MSKILELLLFPIFDNFARCNQLKIELVSQQNFYPDLTFIHEPTGAKFAVDRNYC
ncbi:EcoRV family type II restriction endonuclease [Microcystis aeruginosa]|uniref:EcoRV family type II restriction endonuclease n=1 Tax=Microcystis aeruginosa TaxID=1126 RepID=UPI00214FF7AA|nr:EcoRV family type II restriction endonuclease [Microcystis aeruginosa]